MDTEALGLVEGDYVRITVEGYLIGDSKNRRISAGGVRGETYDVVHLATIQPLPDPNASIPTNIPLIDSDGELWTYAGRGEWSGPNDYGRDPRLPARPLYRLAPGEVVAP